MSSSQPDYQSDEAVLESALGWIHAGQKVALATVVSTWGSAPRPTGSQIAINEVGEFVGSVSGGCIEGAVIHAGLDCLESGKPQELEFGVSNSEAWEVGLACGGKIRIYVTPLTDEKIAVVETLVNARKNKLAVVAVTDFVSGTERVVTVSEANAAGGLKEAVRGVARSDKAQEIDIGDERYFLNPFNPPLRLFVVGAVHIAQPLVRMAAEAGYALTIIDPRQAFATSDRFPGLTLSHDWPDEALEGFSLDARSAVVTLTHDPKIDDPALEAALKSDCFYIGSLGSKKTHGARLERLRRAGFDEEVLARIHGPVGLDIGGKSPAEIAVSILAEITQVLRRPGS